MVKHDKDDKKMTETWWKRWWQDDDNVVNDEEKMINKQQNIIKPEPDDKAGDMWWIDILTIEMPPVLNGRAHKKSARAPVGAGRILKGLRNVMYLNVSIPEPPFQNLDVLHNLNSSGASPSHPPPPSVKQLTWCNCLLSKLFDVFPIYLNCLRWGWLGKNWRALPRSSWSI